MQELIRYEPDLFVICTGHNEFLEERTYPAARLDRSGRRGRGPHADGRRADVAGAGERFASEAEGETPQSRG